MPSARDQHRYLPALDGLRTVSVFIVIAFHHGLLAAGWIGVDLFFALSGFLITGILLQAPKNGYFRDFYLKRTTRILPPVVLLLVIAAFVLHSVSWTFLAYLLFAGNVVELTRASIWLLSPLWSLAIEEHFYFAWPFVLRRFPPRRMLQMTFALLLAEPMLRAVATLVLRHTLGPQLRWNNPMFLLTPFRLDGLLAGALLALLLDKESLPRALPSAIARFALPSSLTLFTFFLGLEALIPSFRRTTDNLAFNTFAYTLTALASAAFIAHLVLQPQARLSRMLAIRPMVLLGRITYGVYLFQLPVKAIMGRLLPHTSDARLFLLDVAATVVIAAISYRYLEQPCMRFGRRHLTANLAPSSDAPFAVMSAILERPG